MVGRDAPKCKVQQNDREAGRDGQEGDCRMTIGPSQELANHDVGDEAQHDERDSLLPTNRRIDWVKVVVLRSVRGTELDRNDLAGHREILLGQHGFYPPGKNGVYVWIGILPILGYNKCRHICGQEDCTMERSRYETRTTHGIISMLVVPTGTSAQSHWSR